MSQDVGDDMHAVKKRRVDEALVPPTTSTTSDIVATSTPPTTTTPRFLSKAEREAAALARVAAKVRDARSIPGEAASFFLFLFCLRPPHHALLRRGKNRTRCVRRMRSSAPSFDSAPKTISNSCKPNQSLPRTRMRPRTIITNSRTFRVRMYKCHQLRPRRRMIDRSTFSRRASLCAPRASRRANSSRSRR